MWTKLFWKDTAERAIATMAQILVTLFAVDTFDLLQADWKATVASVATAGILAVVKSIAAGALIKESVSPASFAPDEKEF